MRISFPKALICVLFGLWIGATNFVAPTLLILYACGYIATKTLAWMLIFPPVIPLILATMSEGDTDLPRWASWFDTPGEIELFAKDEEAVGVMYSRLGWFITAWHWFGIRNRGMGLQSALSVPCHQWIPEDRLGLVRYADGLWVYKAKLGPILFVRGWLVYQDKAGHPSEARPVFSLKYRPRQFA